MDFDDIDPLEDNPYDMIAGEDWDDEDPAWQARLDETDRELEAYWNE